MTHDPYTCDLDPDTKTKMKLYLFRNVKNVDEIRNNVREGTWNCAVIKPCLVLDLLQVVVAANRAAVARLQGNMVTRTVYGEIIYNLSISKKISQSLSKFGIEKGSDMLVCFLVSPEEDSTSEVIPQIQGDLCPMNELSSLTDMKEVKNVYKLTDLKGNVDLLDVILSRMVTKNFVSHA